MRRAGLTGDIWPDDKQELLLRAALLPAAAGMPAWAAVRPHIDVDRLPGELHRLIPLLSKAVSAFGVEDPDLPRLKGVYQFTWYRNQLLFADAAMLVDELETAGVRTMLLRGGAMALACHGDLGLRPMNDLDVLVAPGDLDHSRRVADAAGWLPAVGSEPLETREAAVMLRNDQGRVVRLHWAPSRNISVLGAAPEPIWQRAVPATFNGAATRVPNAADYLLYACIDGARANSGSTLRWITDVTALLNGAPDVDWDVVLAEARRHHVSLLVGEALRYLVGALDVQVPPEVTAALVGTRTTARERIAHRLSLTTSRRAPSAAEVLGRFTRQTADLPLLGAARAVPGFLQRTLAVPRRRDIPAAVVRKAVRAATSPVPPAEPATAGPPQSAQKP